MGFPVILSMIFSLGRETAFKSVLSTYSTEEDKHLPSPHLSDSLSESPNITFILFSVLANPYPVIFNSVFPVSLSICGSTFNTKGS